MCGICGVLAPNPHEELAGLASRMTATLRHRGPDAGGTFVGAGVALGHRRLSIIDLSELGAQPMTLPARQATVTYNGEIYNFRDLRAELEQKEHAFRGHSDTEVLLHLYDEWGLDGLRRLEGIFAFALWDEPRRRLVLMRDRLGVKPLFYARSGSSLLFGSEIKAIFAGGPVPRDIDDQAFSEYLWYGNAFEDRTMYREVRALPPGHWLIVEDGVPRLEAWWQIEEWLNAPIPARAPAEAADAVREALDAAVSRQLISDVPVGIFLSGGVDSSAIAASAARASTRPLASYSVGFDFDRGINELPKASRVASALKLDHHELHVNGDQLEDVVLDLVRAHDEPFADAANIPLFLLAKALEGTLKVVLQGDGGDEMFAGYRRYAILRHAGKWERWPPALSAMLHRLGGERGRRAARMGDAAGASDAAMRMALLLTLETRRDPPTAMFGEDTRRRLDATTDPFLAFRRCAERFRSTDPVNQMLLTDIALQLPSQFLAKVDRATMAHGLEARVPLLDEGVASLAVRLPSCLKVTGTQKKVVLRDAMRGRLSTEVLDGPKTGFGVPYQYWLRDKLHAQARDAMLSSGFVTRFDVDRQALVRALDQHRAGDRDHGFLLWKIFQLALWSDIVN